MASSDQGSYNVRAPTPQDITNMKERIVAMEALKASQGWQVFLALLANDREACIHKAMEARDGNEAQKYLAQAKSAEVYAAFPDLEIRKANINLEVNKPVATVRQTNTNLR